MSLVLGIDSSTQSCKALLVDALTGDVVEERRAAHPGGTQVDPASWVEALESCTSDLLARADAVAVAGQQHGMVALDSDCAVVRDAMLWNDTSSAPEARQLTEELGGPAACADRIGSVMVASFTGSKLRWLANHEPEHAKRTATVLLPHDYLTWHLGGRRGLDTMTTDHGDASGTAYYNTRTRRFEPELASSYLGHDLALPRIAEPGEIVGETASGACIAPGTGDNAAAALGLGLGPGDVCVSIGTSGVASARVEHSVHDPSGLVAGFCDATGAYLPLACTLNGAKVLDFAAMMLGVDHAQLAEMALCAQPGSNGVTMLPYLDGERTPNRPNATGVFRGVTTATTREDLARAVVEGVLGSMADAIRAVEEATGVTTGRVLLVGGAAKSRALQEIAPQIFGVDVAVPQPREYVALGAARQAAWALTGELPAWKPAGTKTLTGEYDAATAERYAALRDLTSGWEDPSE